MRWVNEVFVKKLLETGSTLDTDPSNYIGYEVGDDGKRKKKDKDMADKELHADAAPDGPRPPAIVVQAEGYKPGFSIGLFVEGMLDIPKEEFVSTPLKALNFMHHIQETFPSARLVFEDTTTGQRGYVTPALFVKVYSKMLLSEQDKNKETKTLKESNSKSANMPLANELLAVGLVNNVKGTSKVLREENPMRKAMEIFYASEKSNADVDEKKSAYVPSLLKEGKMTLDEKTSTKTATDTATKKQEEEVAPKKKRLIIW